MKNITDIFESIFDMNPDKIENNSAFYDKKSEFNINWVSQFTHHQNVDFQLDNNVLSVASDFPRIRLDLQIPLSQCLPAIKKIILNSSVNIYMLNKSLDETYLSKTIVFNDTLTIYNASEIKNINLVHSGKYHSIQFYRCSLIKNCSFSKINRIFVSDLNDMGVFKKCKFEEVENIHLNANDIFGGNYDVLNNLIDWDALRDSINSRHHRKIFAGGGASIYNLVEFIKNSRGADAFKFFIIPSKIQTKDVINHLFPDCEFKKLKQFTINDNDVTLKFDLRPRKSQIILYHNSMYGTFNK